MVSRSRPPAIPIRCSACSLALSTASHPHPLLGMLDMYEWVWANGAHELRHAAQIREVAEQLGTH